MPSTCTFANTITPVGHATHHKLTSFHATNHATTVWMCDQASHLAASVRSARLPEETSA